MKIAIKEKEITNFQVCKEIFGYQDEYRIYEVSSKDEASCLALELFYTEFRYLSLIESTLPGVDYHVFRNDYDYETTQELDAIDYIQKLYTTTNDIHLNNVIVVDFNRK